jgi:uncharacterized protein (DUF305 family)
MTDSLILTANKVLVVSGVPLLILLACFLAVPVNGQKPDPSAPVVVRPGAPGQPSRQLPASTKGVLPPQSAKNIEFMQGMIMHHAQAVEMTSLIESHTQNKDIALIGERIRKSQVDEMLFMKRWLQSQGVPASAAPSEDEKSRSQSHHGAAEMMLMPGMLSPKQMEDLKKATGAEFDRLFLSGMIQHHQGALMMVNDLFATPGAGQDAELFNFASDVDSGQRAEIKSMKTLLNKRS